jgi:uncharacterized glyoxalase superfamily metalloenzyme YdcJ
MSAPNRFAQAVQRPAQQPAAVPAVPPRRKYTILLDQSDLRAIDEDVMRLQNASGLRVDRSEVIRALLRQLHTDESLYAEVLRGLTAVTPS